MRPKTRETTGVPSPGPGWAAIWTGLAWIVLAAPALAEEQLGEGLFAHFVERTEVGRIVDASSQDFGPDGTLYQITYAPDGTLVWKADGASGTGYWEAKGPALCRAPEADDVDRRCRIIFRREDGSYVARGASSGRLRYIFRLDAR